jgi:flagellar hook-associated protein 1 FlgK
MKILEAWKEGTTEHPLPKFDIYNDDEPGMTFDAFYKAMVVRLGDIGNASKNFMTAHELIVYEASSARHSLSGVSLDEEMTDMMRFQHAYDAAAKMINVIDSMIDIIVNRLKA